MTKTDRECSAIDVSARHLISNAINTVKRGNIDHFFIFLKISFEKSNVACFTILKQILAPNARAYIQCFVV